MHLAERLKILDREERQMVAVGDLAKDRLQSLREYVARQSGADAAVAGWDLISTALNLLIDMSEAVEATGDSYGVNTRLLPMGLPRLGTRMPHGSPADRRIGAAHVCPPPHE